MNRSIGYDYKVIHADSELKLISKIKQLQDRGWERDERYSLKPKMYYRPEDWDTYPLVWRKVWWIQMKKKMEVSK